jgi:hypothetical protein
MKLELSGNEVSQPIDAALISSLLNSLSDDDSDSFLILSKDDMSYIQTCKTSDGHFVLEYQEKTQAEHYECVDDVLNVQKVLLAFSSYLAGTEEWRTALQWQLQDSAAGFVVTKPVKLLLLVGVVAIVAFTFLIKSL